MFKKSYICLVKHNNREKRVTVFSDSLLNVTQKLSKKYGIDSVEKILEPEALLTKKEHIKYLLCGLLFITFIDITFIFGGLLAIQMLIDMCSRVWGMNRLFVITIFSFFGLYISYYLVKLVYQIIITIYEHKSFFKKDTTIQ